MQGFVDAYRFVDEQWNLHLVPRVVLTIDEWADEHRILPKQTSAEAGPWRTERTPYARQILRDLSDDAPFEDIVLMCATQLVKSECGLNWLGSIVDQTPGPMMIVQATVDTGKRYSRQRVGPMVSACPALRGKVKDARSRDSGNTLQMKEFPGGVVVITGANSGAGLASMPAKYIHFDERDDYPDDVDGQGEPTRVARARQDTFFRRKRLTSSSPKRPKGQSRIEEEFRAGTRFYFHVHCPHCARAQRLEFEHLRMAESGRSVYACPHCGGVIEEHDKTELLAGGEWIPENPAAKARSYHLNSLYSPLGWLSWSDLMREYGEAKAAQDRGDDAPMKTFLNTRLAQTFEEKTDRVEGDELRDRAEDYELRVVPAAAVFLTAGVDVQDNRFEVVLYAWGPGEESWVVDYVALAADPAQESSWSVLSDYLDSTFDTEDGRKLSIHAEAIDTGGHFTHAVYGFCRTRERKHKRTFAIKGAERPGLPVKGKSSLMDVNRRGKIVPKGVKLWFVGTDTAKDLLHNRLRMAKPGPGYIHLARELPHEFFAGMSSEQRVKQRTARGDRFSWVKLRSNVRNEPWDCSVYALFAAHALDLPRYTARMWEIARKRQERRRDAMVAADEAERPREEPIAVEEPKQPVPVKRRSLPRRGGFVNNW